MMLPVALLQLNEGQLDWMPKNPRQWTQDGVNKAKDSLERDPDFLDDRPLLVVPHDGAFVVYAGNMRLTAARELGVEALPCVSYEPESVEDRDTIKRRAILDNGDFGAWDWDALANEWDDLPLGDWGVPNWDTEKEKVANREQDGDGLGEEEFRKLEDYFIIPPISVLDARSGRWQERKTLWREKIGDHGESRELATFSAPSMRYPTLYHKFGLMKKRGEVEGISFPEWLKTLPPDVMEKADAGKYASGVSVLDPVLAEVVCRWFGLPEGKAFDPFAGDTVFGFVSAAVGMSFTGIELREEQARLNNARTAEIDAHYICDDGQNVASHFAPKSQDLLFSCPPYFDLEVYSDDPRDASNQKSYEEFLNILRNAFTSAVGCLNDNRFAVIVVGDVRDKKYGGYYDFPGDVTRIFKDAGLFLLNELILVDPIGTAAIRAAGQMKGRKVPKTHQNVLVFYKGDPRKIMKIYPDILFEDASEDLESFEVDN